MKRFLLPVLPALLGLLLPGGAGAQITDAEFHQRRTALTEVDGDGVTVVLGSAQRGAHLSFQYLTGIMETDAALLVVREGDRVETTIYLDTSAPAPLMADGSTFSGSGDGVGGAPRVREAAAFEGDLAALVARFGSLGLVGPDDLRQTGASTASQALARRVEGETQGDAELEIRRGNARVTQMRAVKSPAELDLIRRAVEITEAAHRALLGEIRPGITEADLKVVIDSVFRAMGADPRSAFEHIVASAENSTILHYRGGDRVLGEDEHVKIDIGAAFHGYAADVTRTYPVNGTFSPELRAIYGIVRDAQARAEAMAAEGAARSDMSQAANEILARGLAGLGLIEAPDATWDCPVRGGGGMVGECPQLGLLYFHALGHGIGLNVHDPTPPTTVVGSAISIEPGIYVRPGHLATLPDTPRNRALIEAVGAAWERHDGIGVRIEDDYLMLPSGLEWISRAPREIDEIEEAMAEARARRALRP